MILGFDATTLAGRLSGVGYYTARLLEALAGSAGDGAIERLVVLSNREVPLPSSPRVDEYRRRRFPVRAVWMQAVLPFVLRDARPDLVHFTNYLAPAFPGVPYVVSFHDMTLFLVPQYHTLKKRLLTSSLMPHVARGARRILVPSESSGRDVTRLLGIDPARIALVPYAASEQFRPVPTRPAHLESAYGIREPYLLYVGTLEPRKNLVRVLRAFARIRDAHPDVELVLAGETGWQCDELLAEAARAPRVRITGYVAEGDLPALYASARAFVYPSLYEGFGLPVVEAMACGVPVLTSATSSLGEIARDAAVLVDPLDEAALAGGMDALLRDGALREDLRTRGFARAATFSWERTARETVAVYREALA